MTDIERAIETLKDMKSYFNDRSHRQYSMPAINLAIEALEKQIPKNVIIENGWKYCPACYECINDDYGTETNYCSDCGQKLDWSVEE